MKINIGDKIGRDKKSWNNDKKWIIYTIVAISLVIIYLLTGKLSI